MKKKSASRSAFFNLRVLIGLFIVLAGVSLALIGLGTFSGLTASSAQAQQKHKIINIQGLPPGFDCATIHQKGIDRMEGFRAGLIMIACGEATGGSGSPSNALVRLARELLPVPLAYGAADVDLVTGTETPPHIIQSETYSTANPDNPDEICVAFNDSRGANVNDFSGVSCSTDGGMTFTRVTNASGQSPFANTFGDPVILYNRPTQTWFTVWLDANGSCTLGGYKSSTPEDPNSWTHFCVHSNGGDDRESGWADNNTSSPHFGNMYVSWNDFNVGGGALQVRVSTDNGNTWTQHGLTNSFIRDVQITGDPVTGDVYVAGMDEGGGGFPHNDTNYIFRSTDGGNTWANTYVGGTSFPGPGVVACSDNPYFTCMFPDAGGFWRHEGWGEPAAYNGVVHLVYAQHGAGTDPGDVYYIRSTDRGQTFGTPVKLNTDSTTRPQWQPNLSVSDAGTVFAMWYDARESTSCTKGNPSVPCYRMWARKSNDNGATWLPDDMLSDVVSPLPGQSDPNIVTGYAGDYDYGSAILTKHVTSWDDGRVAIGGASQQDTFTDRELVGFAVTTSDPACNAVINTQPTDFVINLSDAVDTSTVQPTDFTVNGTPADSDSISADHLSITFHFNSSPVTAEGLQTMHIPADAFNRESDGMGNFEFQCTFCYAVTPLQVTTTNPPVGGTFSPPAPGDYSYDVNFNQAVDPASVDTSDLTLTGNVGGSVTAVQLMNGNTTAHFTLHFDNGGSVTASIGAGSITANGCNGNAAFSGMYTVEGPAPCAWAAGPSMPTVGTRMVGVFFPANGKFYAMGGRSSDVGGSEFTHPYEYDPVSNSWTIKSATYPDNHVNNMACGVLTESGIPYIYCVGGSEVATQTATGRVFRYDPITDTLTTVPANWPSGDQNIIPGGFSVINNTMVILGGFTINVAMDDNIWQFDPVALVWTHKNSHLPTPLGYIPQSTIGNLIYTGGGSTYDGTLLHDSNFSLVYDPVADTLGNIATIPRATAETRGLNLCNTMYVMGGGREAPNPSNEVDIYDPVANSWSVGTPFSEARRNFPTDTDGTTRIWLSGGYASDGVTVLDSMEIFTCPVSPCASPSPTPTATPTATATATATATPTASATPTATSTPRHTPTPRPAPTARPRPTPAPRP